MKKFSVILMTLLLTFNLHAVGGGKLLDLLLNESGLVELLTKNGIEGAAAAQVKSYVKNSILSLSVGSNMPSGEALLTIIKGLENTPADRRVKANLLKVLDKNADELKKADIVDAVNDLIFLANRHGVRGSLVLACSECVNNALFSHGFRFTLEEVTQSSVRQLLESNVIPREPRALSQFISNKMTRLGMGSFNRASADLVAPEEEKALAIFLALADKGSPATAAQREFIDSVVAVSTVPGGEVKLLNPENPHKFWKLFDDSENTDNVLAGYATILKETAEEAKTSVNKKEAFYDVLQRSAGDSEEATLSVNAIRMKNCFFGR
ncbi:MAG: hypothetical protein K9K67_11820 [Bacteriovoracaceae bacterium]|nr:hypothetical protein [Bacteriovoracaceae bacterium]